MFSAPSLCDDPALWLLEVPGVVLLGELSQGTVPSPSSLCTEGKPPPWGLTEYNKSRGWKVLSGRRDNPELCGRRPKIVAQEITNMPQSQLPSLSRACGFVPSRPLAEAQDEWALTIYGMEHFESKMGQLATLHFRVAKTTPACA